MGGLSGRTPLFMESAVVLSEMRWRQSATVRRCPLQGCGDFEVWFSTAGPEGNLCSEDNLLRG